MALVATTSVATAYTGSFDTAISEPPSLFEGGGVYLEVSNVSGFSGLSSAPALAPTFDPEYHEIFFVHTLRETTLGSKPLIAHTAPANMLPAWNEPNVKYGKIASWGNLPAGTYYVDSWAVGPNGEEGIQTAGPFTVATQDSTFPTTQTICLSTDPSETWVEEKSGCQRATSWAAAESIIEASTSPIRLLLKRGQTLDRGDTTRILLNADGDGFLNCVDAWGSGSLPAINTINDNIFYFAGASNDINHFVCRNVRFYGDWDASICEGLFGQSPFYFRDHSVSDSWFMISDCEFEGLYLVELTTDQTVGGQVVQCTNSTFTNWMDYGIYATGENSTSKIFVEGNRAAQNVNGLNGGPGGRVDLLPRHGSMRFPGYSHIGLCLNDGFNRQGWSLLGSYPNTVDQTFARLFGSGATPVDGSCYVDRNVMEAGLQAGLALAGESASATENPGNFVIERNLIIATAMTSGFTSAFARIDLGGTSVRNNLCVMKDVPTVHGGLTAAFYKGDSSGSTTANQNSPVRIYHNTIYTAQSAANFEGSGWTLWDAAGSDFVTVEDENNLLYAPDIDTPVTPGYTMDVATSVSGVAARFKGVKRFPDSAWAEVTGESDTANSASMTFGYPAGTDQTYWQARNASETGDALKDGDDGVYSGGPEYYLSEGDFSLTFAAGNIEVENTSGASWTRPNRFLRLDDSIRSLGDGDGSALDATYDSSGAVPIVRPASNQAAASGYRIVGDFLTLPEESADSRNGTPTVGAVQV